MKNASTFLINWYVYIPAVRKYIFHKSINNTYVVFVKISLMNLFLILSLPCKFWNSRLNSLKILPTNITLITIINLETNSDNYNSVAFWTRLSVTKLENLNFHKIYFSITSYLSIIHKKPLTKKFYYFLRFYHKILEKLVRSIEITVTLILLFLI